MDDNDLTARHAPTERSVDRVAPGGGVNNLIQSGDKVQNILFYFESALAE